MSFARRIVAHIFRQETKVEVRDHRAIRIRAVAVEVHGAQLSSILYSRRPASIKLSLGRVADTARTV
jgi:hypothetical protein